MTKCTKNRRKCSKCSHNAWRAARSYLIFTAENVQRVTDWSRCGSGINDTGNLINKNGLPSVFPFYFNRPHLFLPIISSPDVTRWFIFRWPIELCAGKSNDLNDWTNVKCSLILLFSFFYFQFSNNCVMCIEPELSSGQFFAEWF